MRKPKFQRQDLHKKKRLKPVWRKPKGIHSKLRRFQSKGLKPSIGFKKQASQEIVIQVENEQQLKALKQEAKQRAKPVKVVIASNVGLKKKIKLLQLAKENNIQVLNHDLERLKQKFENLKKLKAEALKVKEEKLKAKTVKLEKEQEIKQEKQVEQEKQGLQVKESKEKSEKPKEREVKPKEKLKEKEPELKEKESDKEKEKQVKDKEKILTKRV